MDDVARHWTRRLAAILAVGTVALGGCSQQQAGNDSLPRADAPATTSTSELPPLGPPDLPMPAQARTQDPAGAQAFVRYYIDLINRTSTVMDAAPLREFSNGCENCNRIASNVEADARAGYKYDGGRVEIIELPAPLLKQSTAEMAIVVNQSALRVSDSTGRSVDDLNSGAYSGLSGGAALTWAEDRQIWLMTTLTLQ